MRRAGFFSILAALVVSGGSTAIANNIPNYSFESPVVPAVGFGVSLTIDKWTTTGPAAEIVDIGSGPQNSGVGIYSNPATGVARISNADQNQLVYMFSGSTHTLSQTLTGARFQQGQQYTFTAGVADAGSPPTAGDKLSLQFYYVTNAAQTTPVLFGTPRNIVQGTDPLNNELSANYALTDYSVSTGVLASGNLAIGNTIGLMFTTTGTGGGQFDLDNVRLVPDVPEPSAAGFAAIAAVSLLLVRRRATC